MGIGSGKGKNRAQDAAVAAISSPLLDFPVRKAKGIVFNVVGGADLTLAEINAAAEVVHGSVDPEANIIFGATIDAEMTKSEVSITVLATGFGLDLADLAAIERGGGGRASDAGGGNDNGNGNGNGGGAAGEAQHGAALGAQGGGGGGGSRFESGAMLRPPPFAPSFRRARKPRGLRGFFQQLFW